MLITMCSQSFVVPADMCAFGSPSHTWRACRNFDYDAALAFVRKRRFVDPNLGFEEQLRAFESKIVHICDGGGGGGGGTRASTSIVGGSNKALPPQPRPQWLQVGLWESSLEANPSSWPDFPDVLDNLGDVIDSVTGWGEGGGAGGGAGADAGKAGSKPPKVIPFYVCGTDHADKCGLWYGMGARRGVAVVQRAGDSMQTPSSSVDGMVVAVPANSDSATAAISSTKLRKALQDGDLEFAAKMTSEAAVEAMVANKYYSCKPI